MNLVKMKLRLQYLWSLIILPIKFHDAAATRSAAATYCSNQKCCSNLLQNCVHVKLKLKYDKLESHGLLQIAANLANFFPYRVQFSIK